MSDTKWSVSKYAGQHVRCEPRGPTGTVLRPLEFDAAQALDPGVQARLIADISARLQPAMSAHPDAQRFVLLRRKKEMIEHQKRDAELHQQQTGAKRARHVLAALQDDSGERLAQLDSELRGIGHQIAGLGGLLKALEPEIAKAKAAAERALKGALAGEVSAAITRACELRGKLLEELCQIAGPKLDELAAVAQTLSQLSFGPDGLFLLMKSSLDSIELPPGTSADATPLPAAEAPATTDAGVRVELLAGGYASQTTLPAGQTNYTLHFADPAAAPAPSPQPQPSEEQTAAEDEPTDEPRGKSKRRPAKVQ